MEIEHKAVSSNTSVTSNTVAYRYATDLLYNQYIWQK